MINIAVCDDDLKQLKKITEIVSGSFSQHTDDFVIKSFENGTALLMNYFENNFDVLFLDIDMPQLSGFDIAKELRMKFSSCFIIFVTSYSELVYKSFDYQPFHFIKKNARIIMEKDMNDVVEKLMIHMKQNKKIILNDPIIGRKAFYYRNISYIKSDGHYLLYYLQKCSEPLRVTGKINDISEEYENLDFIRIHRSMIVNLRYLNNIDLSIGKLYVLHNDVKIRLPIGNKYAGNLDVKFTEYIRSTV